MSLYLGIVWSSGDNVRNTLYYPTVHRTVRNSALYQHLTQHKIGATLWAVLTCIPIGGQMVQQLTAEEVAETLKVHRETVLRWLRCGKLTASKPGRKWLVNPQDLERFLAEHRN